MRVKLNRKGQITIPKSLRDQFGMEPGTAVDIIPSDYGHLTLTKVRPPRGPIDFSTLRGRLDLGMTTDEYMLWLRGEPDS
jgi:AbrB family looped-hinge helix DNA binding protein